MWFIIQLAKSYTYSTQVVLSVVNVPSHIAIDSAVVVVPFQVEASGFRLWTYNLSKKKVNIDFSKVQQDPSELIIKSNLIKNLVADEGDFIFSNIDLYDDYTTIAYTTKASKKVPVVSNIDYQFADGYNSLEEIKLIPDSVLLTGANRDLQNTLKVETALKKITKLNQNLTGFVALENPNPKLQLSVNEIAYSLKVEKFSEKSVETEIIAVNVPDSLKLTIFPDKAKLTFLVSLEAFDHITGLDFKITCDYNQRYEDEAVMIPKLEEYPEEVKHINLFTKKVNYLLETNKN